MLISSVPLSRGCRAGFLFHPFWFVIPSAAKGSQKWPVEWKRQGTENSRKKGKSRTALNSAPVHQSVQRPPPPQPPPPLSPTTAPLFCHPERSRGICFAPFSLHKFLQSSSIGHAEEPFFQQECRKVTPGNEAAAIETDVPLPIRSWSSVKICGGRKAQSRSLDCARDDKRGRGNGKGRGTENSRKKGSHTQTSTTLRDNKASLTRRPRLSPTTAPTFVIPSAVEGSAVRFLPP